MPLDRELAIVMLISAERAANDLGGLADDLLCAFGGHWDSLLC